MLQNAATKRAFMTLSFFLMSGAVHQITSWKLHPDCGDYADLQFFGMNAAAVILESVLLQAMSSQPLGLGGDRKVERSHPHRLLRSALARFVGYAWVMAFFVWAIPRFYYTRIDCVVKSMAANEG